MIENFTEDQKIQQIAEAYALDAVDFAKNHFKQKLDWSDGSIANIEKILGVFHEQLAEAQPTKEEVLQFAKIFGSYIGEVFRRNHGATWGMVNLNGEGFPGLKSNGSAGLFWPWGRVQNRLLNGSEDNVYHYYQTLVKKNGAIGGNISSITQHLTTKKSWWRRLFGG